MRISRRQFVLGATAAIALRKKGLVLDLQSSQPSRQEGEACGLIPRWSPPWALEMPLPAARSWITPNECFYVFNHAGAPQLDLSSWRLKVRGGVERPLEVDFPGLERFRTAEVINTLECAGNGRAFFEPGVPGVRWQRGAVSNAVFRGPRLRDLLAAAKLKKSTAHIAFLGTDAISGSQPSFVRSIPLEKALDPDTILAVTMNGKPLSPEHGFPVRALVPGWIGAASVKRITAICALEHEAVGFFMEEAYRLLASSNSGHPGQDAGSVALTSLQVKSIITEPLDGAQLPRGPIAIRGAAWAGEAAVAKVEVSVDSGASWHPARLKEPAARYAWRFWEYDWTPQEAGEYEVAVRATDSKGHSQPQAPPWNPRGYLWNGIDKIRIAIT